MRLYVFVFYYEFETLDIDVFQKLDDGFYLIETCDLSDFSKDLCKRTRPYRPIPFCNSAYHLDYKIVDDLLQETGCIGENIVQVLFQTYDNALFEQYINEYRMVYKL